MKKDFLERATSTKEMMLRAHGSVINFFNGIGPEQTIQYR
jgi:hypothetical protein